MTACAAQESRCANKPIWILGNTTSHTVKRFCNVHAEERVSRGGYLVLLVSPE